MRLATGVAFMSSTWTVCGLAMPKSMPTGCRAPLEQRTSLATVPRRHDPTAAPTHVMEPDPASKVPSICQCPLHGGSGQVGGVGREGGDERGLLRALRHLGPHYRGHLGPQ